MCTVTILRRPGRLLVTMNRDERWTRAHELPPKLHPAEGGRRAWIAPTDSERNGTWIGTNDAGVVACLLNAYAPGDLDLVGRPDVPSRGEIVPAVLACDPESATRFLEEELEPERYPSFILVVACDEWVRQMRWTLGGSVEHEELDRGWSLITSSWWRAADVVAWRQRRFESWIDDGAPFEGSLPAFNLLEAPGEREHSPFMTRSYSGTRSLTQVEVDYGAPSATMRYWARTGDRVVDAADPTTENQLPLRVWPSNELA